MSFLVGEAMPLNFANEGMGLSIGLSFLPSFLGLFSAWMRSLAYFNTSKFILLAAEASFFLKKEFLFVNNFSFFSGFRKLQT